MNFQSKEFISDRKNDENLDISNVKRDESDMSIKFSILLFSF